MQDSTRNSGQTRRIWWRGGAAAAVGALLWVGVAGVAGAGTTPQALPATDLTGCCVCRGTNGGSATTIRSCTDGAKVDSCVSQCKSQNADSLAFGKNETCSQGCAGFATQNLH